MVSLDTYWDICFDHEFVRNDRLIPVDMSARLSLVWEVIRISWLKSLKRKGLKGFQIVGESIIIQFCYVPLRRLN